MTPQSIYWRIVLWFSASFLVAIAGFVFIGISIERGSAGNSFFGQILQYHLGQARLIYESQGAPGLREYLRPMNEIMWQHFLLDSNHRDLLTGEIVDYQAQNRFHYTDGGYTMVVAGGPKPELSKVLPLFGLLLVVTIGIGLIFALTLARPLRELGGAVARFGLGDLSVRVQSRRKDEIGNVSRAFDEMADRVQNLLTAEHRLIQDVAHELRTPLARLSLAIDLNKNNPDRDEGAASLKKEVRRLGGLINELLHMIQAEGDPAERRREQLDANELVQSVVNDCMIEMVAKGGRILVNRRRGSGTMLEGDPEQLRRAIENIIRNAVRYSDNDRDVEVWIGGTESEIEIAVRDFGPGVPAEHLPSLFKPFFRVEQDRSRASGGLGLGLSIAQRAVVLHRGRIRAENAAPGLRVRITLPVSAVS